MKSIVSVILERFGSQTFLRSLILILLAEAITILVAWRLLDINVDRWLAQKTAQAVNIAEQAATSNDWSQIDQIQTSASSAVLKRSLPLFNKFNHILTELDHQHFKAKEGAVYIAIIKSGEEYDLGDSADSPGMIQELEPTDMS